MRLIFHVGILCILIAGICALPLFLEDGQTSIEIQSMLDNFYFDMLISIKGKQGTQLSLTSSVLSSKHRTHTIILGEQRIMVQPQIDDETIEHNYYDEEKEIYEFAVKNKMPKRNIQFVPVRIQKDGSHVDVFLTNLDMTMAFLPQSSFYRCDNVLISLRKTQNNNEEIQEILMFTKDPKENNFFLQGQWDQIWRHYDDGVFFGGAKRASSTQKIKIHLSSKRICEFHISEIPEAGDVLNLDKYYEIKDLLKWAPKLPTYLAPSNQDL